MNIYLLLKLVHIIAVVMFLGNIITGLFWMKQADKTNNAAIISFAIKGVIRSDKLFTLPGVVIITAGGIAAASHASISFTQTGWLFWPIVLFSFSGIAFMWKVAPLQKKIYKVAGSGSAFDRPLYKSLLKEWELCGLVALLTPMAALVMMVLKIPVSSGL